MDVRYVSDHKNKSYIDFWHTLMNILYPNIHEIHVQKRFKFDSTAYKSGLVVVIFKISRLYV